MCVESTALLFTDLWLLRYISSNHVVKFADDIAVVGLISCNDETNYRAEVEQTGGLVQS